MQETNYIYSQYYIYQQTSDNVQAQEKFLKEEAPNAIIIR
jgi:hypothetical protein